MSEFDPSTDMETTHILVLAGYSKKKTTQKPKQKTKQTTICAINGVYDSY